MSDIKTSEILKAREKEEINETVEQYVNRFESSDAQSQDEKVAESAELSKEYYRVATNFYLHGWGRLFHFGARKKNGDKGRIAAAT